MNPTPLHRALSAAPERASVQKAKAEQELFCFRVGELRLAVPSGHVREVVRVNALTPLPRTPAYVVGVMGHRGEVLPVLDLLRFLGKGESRPGTRSRLFIAIAGPFVAGVLTDEIMGLHRIPVDEILPPPLGGDSSADHVSGLIRPEWARTGVSLLDFEKVLEGARQRTVAR